jgi:hypothetical protein
MKIQTHTVSFTHDEMYTLAHALECYLMEAAEEGAKYRFLYEDEIAMLDVFIEMGYASWDESMQHGADEWFDNLIQSNSEHPAKKKKPTKTVKKTA